MVLFSKSDSAKMEEVMFAMLMDSSDLKALNDFKALITSGVNVETRFGNDNHTPLTFASAHHMKEIVKYLLSMGAKSDAVATHGTALHYATIFDDGKVSKILLEFGANVEALDNDGKTPMQKAHHPTAAIPLILGGAKYPYSFSQIDPEAYKVKDLQSAIVASKLYSGETLSEAEVSFKGSNDYMPEYEGLYQETMASIDAHKNPQLEITDGDSSGVEGNSISQFHTGFYTGNFVVSPAINYLNDGVKGVNAEKPLLDYYADKMNHNTIAKSVVFSFVYTALPNSLSIANKILAAKIVSDASISGIDLSSEYASSLVLHLASSIASFSTIGFVHQTEFYNNHPFITGVIAGTASEGVSLLYDAANMMQNYMAGEGSSLVSEAAE